ncbi:MAG: hypothetical protein HUU41_14965 [Bryobacteraceae bacterium]|nr:hypothetical protein [Bryobacteraceae bacterium]
MRLFLNLENLTNVRQTRWNSLLRPNRAPDGRWTVDAWAPLDGRVINGGVRFLFATRVVRRLRSLSLTPPHPGGGGAQGAGGGSRHKAKRRRSS